MITAGVVLLATSTASSTAPVDAHRPADPERAPTEDHAAAQGPNRLPFALPMATQAIDTVDNVDAGATIPTVFTGDIPASVLKAYLNARDLINSRQPGCHLPLELLEAIGKVETGHARHGLVDANGTTLSPILGPVLDGNGFAAIPDTDGGRYDGDPVWDRAVGPMQFIPGTWAGWFADGNGDHNADPHNVYDASLAAARYLCAANRDLGTPEGLDEAIFSYNHSTSYRNLVLSWMSTYATGTVVIPDAAANPRAPMVIPALAFPASTAASTAPAVGPTSPAETSPAAPPATEPQPTQPPASTTPPTTAPPSTPPTTQPPTTTPPPTTQPPTTSTPPAGPVQGLVCGVTGLVGGLLGGQPPNC
jgi:hypothetical protein